MTNKEKYLDELIKIWETGYQFGLIDGNIVSCDGGHKCTECTFYKASTCNEGRAKWLKKEYGVKASTLSVDTRIVLHSKGTGRTINRYFSHFGDDCIYYFCGGSDSWSSEDIGTSYVSKSGSFIITLTDGTPVVFE